MEKKISYNTGRKSSVLVNSAKLFYIKVSKVRSNWTFLYSSIYEINSIDDKGRKK